jgi:threonine synthase
VKYEGLNPTCSFKDRGMTMAVSKAVEQGTVAVICASTGNTSASAAAYAARAGIRCAVVLPAGKIASGKLLQAFAYGAKVVAIDGNFDDALLIVRALGARDDFAIVNSINPDRIAGQKTAAFEIVDDLGDAPDLHLLPLGNAGNITAYWAGYREYRDAGNSTRLPAMIGFQAAGAAPMFHGRVVENPETIASAIRIGNPASWEAASRAVQDSRGAIDIVTGAGAIRQHKCFAQKRKVKNKIGIKLRYVITGIVGSRKMTNRRLPENTFTGQCQVIPRISYERKFSSNIRLAGKRRSLVDAIRG